MMLINTVVLLLRELLPVVLLLSLLLAANPSKMRDILLRVLMLGAPLLLLQSSQYSHLAELWDGQGLEFWYACCYGFCALLIAALLLQKNQHVWLAATAVVALLLINGSNLMLYLFLYPRQLDDSQSLWLGVALGSGISLSIAVLIYHLVLELRLYWRQVAAVLLCFSAARQVSAAVFILHQMDLLGGAAPMLSQHLWIDESSELGYFLNALLGYKSSPSQGQLLAWSLTLILLLVLRRRELKS